MSEPWVSGRFRGVYAGERAPDGDGVRRLPVEIEYGQLEDVASAEAPPDAAAPDELRFDRLRRVTLAPRESGLPRGERTLFDVRIRDWRLLYPAESSQRVYGTLVGVLSARLAPVPVEAPPSADLPPPERRPPPPAEAAPAAPAPAAPSEPARRGLAVPDLGVDRRDTSTPAQDLARLFGLVAAMLMLIIGSALVLGCGPATAAIWGSALFAAIGVRWAAAPVLIRSVPGSWLLGSLCWLVMVQRVIGPLQIAWTTGCRPPIRGELLVLGGALLASALVRMPLFVWASAAIWTATLCGWCSELDGNCPAAAEASGAPASPWFSPPDPLPRTDAQGRWPAAPDAARPPEPEASGAPQVDLPPLSAPLPAPAPARTEPASGRVEIDGGWIEPGRPRAALAEPRMSLEQANREPEAFFAAPAPRRVYVQTDDIFQVGSAELLSGGDVPLARLANLLRLHPERPAVIEIHTDASGDAQRWLSEQRADVVRAWLVDRGHLDADQLRFALVGNEQPLVPADGSYAERRPNRRLEVHLAEPTS